uniref:Uncharacterized protein n=1 Tax=Naja naja TaxID=35670 RepID=A0A8C6XLW3_NAJNA
MPKSRAFARAMRRVAKALKFFSSSEITRAFSFFTIAHTVLSTRTVLTVLSPFLGAEDFRGKRMSLERYSFSLWTLACKASVDLFRRLGSTAIPIVRANFFSSRLNPLPRRTFVWYRTVGHLTTGLTGGSPADLPGRLVEPGGHASLPVLMEVGLQDHAIPAGRHVPPAPQPLKPTGPPTHGCRCPRKPR